MSRKVCKICREVRQGAHCDKCIYRYHDNTLFCQYCPCRAEVPQMNIVFESEHGKVILNQDSRSRQDESRNIIRQFVYKPDAPVARHTYSEAIRILYKFPSKYHRFWKHMRGARMYHPSYVEAMNIYSPNNHIIHANNNVFECWTFAIAIVMIVIVALLCPRERLAPPY